MNHITFFSRYLNESLNNILTYSPYVLRTRSNRKKMKRRNETFIFESITEHREFIYLYFIYIQNTNQSGEKKSLAKRKKKFCVNSCNQPCSHKHSHSLWVLINCFILVFFSMYMLHYFHYFRKHICMFLFASGIIYTILQNPERKLKETLHIWMDGWNIRNVE